MTSKFSIDNRELLQRISSGEAVVGIDFGNLIVRELAAFRLAAMDSESEYLPLDYLQGHKDGLEWAAQLAEANHPETGDWLYDDPIELAKAIRKGPDMPPVQPVADSEPVAYMYDGEDGREYNGHNEFSGGGEGIPLYRHAQPAQVVPNGLRLALSNAGIAAPESDEMLAATCEKHIQALVTWVKDRKPFQSAPVVPSFEEWLSAANRKPLGWVKDAMREAYDACRAAMLQSGNSPVIPDGYVMVPREPTEEMNKAGWAAMNEHDAINPTYRAMIAAAPHEAPALNSVQSVVTVPGKWIPVSERMPEVGVKVLCFPVKDEPIHATFNGQLWLQDISWSGSDDPIDNVIPTSVTHWMPLPAAPQEAKDDINALIPLVSRNEQEVK